MKTWLLFFFVVSFQVYSFSFKDNFYKTSDSKLLIAVKSYTNGIKNVEFLGTPTMAEKEYYEELNRLVAGKVVIHLDHGFDIKEKILNLSEQEQDDFCTICENRCWPIASKLGLTWVLLGLNITSAKSLHHGDVERLVEDTDISFTNKTREWLDKKINNDFVRLFFNDKRTPLNASIKEKAASIFEKRTFGWTRERLVEQLLQVNDYETLINQLNNNPQIRAQLKNNRFYLRQKILLNKLKELLAYEDNIVILADPLFFRFMEDAIDSLGFVPATQHWFALFPIL